MKTKNATTFLLAVTMAMTTITAFVVTRSPSPYTAELDQPRLTPQGTFRTTDLIVDLTATADGGQRIFDRPGPALVRDGVTPNQIDLNLAGASCAAGSFVTAISTVGTGTCTPASGTISGLTTNQTVKASSSTSVTDAWPADNGTIWGVAGKFTINEANGNTAVNGTLTADGGVRVFDVAGNGLSSTLNRIDVNIAGASCAAGSAVTSISSIGTGVCGSFIGSVSTDGVTIQGDGSPGSPVALKQVFVDGATGTGTSASHIVVQTITGPAGAVDTSSGANGITMFTVDPGNVSIQAQNSGAVANKGSVVIVADGLASSAVTLETRTLTGTINLGLANTTTASYDKPTFFLEDFHDGAGVAGPVPVGAAGIGRLRWNTASAVMELSKNGGAFGSFGTGTVTSVTCSTGLTCTAVNPIVGAGTITMANTAVTPASYTNANITVDQQGRITSASNGSSSGMAIGGTVTSGTAKSVLFVGAGPVLAQDNADFRWDPNAGLQLGPDAVSAAFAGFSLMVGGNNADVTAYFWSSSTAALPGVGWLDSSRGLAGIVGFGGSTTGITNLRGLNFFYDNGKNVVIMSGVDNTIAHKFFDASSNVGYQLADGQSAAGGASATGKLRYNSVGTVSWGASGTLEASLNGNTYWKIIMDPTGNTPTASSCGGGTTQTGNSRKGSITVQNTTCVLAFANNLASCNITPRNGVNPGYSISGANLTLTTTVSGQIYDWDCN